MAMMTMALVAAAGLKAFAAYDTAVTNANNARATAVGDQMRAIHALVDLPFALRQNQMAMTQVGMVSRAHQGEMAVSDAQLAQIDMERELVQLDAAQQERGRQRRAMMQDQSAIAAAAAMGMDPSTSGTFAMLQGENRAVVADDIQAIRLNAGAALVGNSMEKGQALGQRGAILMAEGANQTQRGSIARGQVQIAMQQDEAVYARDVAAYANRQAGRAKRRAWITAGSSLLGSAIAAR